MRHVEVHMTAVGRSAAEVYTLLSEFERYPEHTATVRAVRVVPIGDRCVLSSWEVTFREGILQWTEQDDFDPVGRTIRFRQTEGDTDYFAGEWVVEDIHKGCVIRFSADFDLGIPDLGATLEPIAERALRDNIQSIVAGLLRARVRSNEVAAIASATGAGRP